MTHDEAAVLLGEARDRTWQLVAPLSEEDLHAQHDVLTSPIIWDLGHIAHFEELYRFLLVPGVLLFALDVLLRSLVLRRFP